MKPLVYSGSGTQQPAPSGGATRGRGARGRGARAQRTRVGGAPRNCKPRGTKRARVAFDEKLFFEAARRGNIQELKRQAEALKSPRARAAASADTSGVDRRHPLGWTALMAAAVNDRASAVSALLALGAKTDAREEYAGAEAMATNAANTREDEFCASIDANASFLGWMPLHYAALADSADSVRALLEAGADPMARDLENSTPLHNAAVANSIECARALVNAGADPTATDSSGRRPSDYARNPSAIREFLNQAAKCWASKAHAAANEESLRANAAAAAERRRTPLEERCRREMIGQHGAIQSVAAAVRRKEAGLHDENHPLVMMFLGSSGVGKTELAKQLARYMHADDPEAFIRLDMSEYQQKHEVSKLIGSPPGYMGYDEGGQLTRALGRKPNAVVLLDEVDKAHPDVLTVLLQLFDEGRLTDGQGHLIECKDAVFVMTSNLAAKEIAEYGLELRHEKEGRAEGGTQKVELLEVSRQFQDQVVQPILKRHFRRDEFLGRIDELVYLMPFSRSEILTLVQLELGRWATAVKRHGIALQWDADLVEALANLYDVNYGARSIQHEVERRVVNRLALAIQRGLLPRGSVAMLKPGSRTKVTLSVSEGGGKYRMLELD